MDRPKIQNINYKGKQILVLDFSQDAADFNKTLATIKDAYKAFQNRPLKSILLCSVVTNMRFSNEILAAFQDIMKTQDPYIKAVAVVGVSGLQKVALNFLKKFTSNMTSVGTEEEAKEWLANYNG